MWKQSDLGMEDFPVPQVSSQRGDVATPQKRHAFSQAILRFDAFVFGVTFFFFVYFSHEITSVNIQEMADRITELEVRFLMMTSSGMKISDE